MKQKQARTETHQKEWFDRIASYDNDGTLQRMVDTELFNLSWKITVRAIINTLDMKNGESILEAGCGWGRVLGGIKYYLPQVSIEGIELVDTLVQKANSLIEHYRYDNAHAVQGDILDMSRYASNTYDAVYSPRVLHYIVDKENALRNLHRVLKPCGRIMISIPNRHCPHRWFSYSHPLYSIYRLRRLLKAVGFVEVKTGSFGFVPPPLTKRPFGSWLYNVDKLFQYLPGINRLGALAYVCAKKRAA